MKTKLITVALTALFCAVPSKAQMRLPAYDSRINPELLKTAFDDSRYNESRWSASWICTPDADEAYGVYMFRKDFELESVPESFVVNVSADNRYKLYVNGTYVDCGPAKGDAHNWNFDTHDIARYLHPGKNVAAAVVWHFASYRPVAVMSFGRPGWIVQGNTEAEKVLNTDKSWKGIRCEAYSPIGAEVRGYYAAGCLDRVNYSVYPVGWQKEDFDDSSWSPCMKIRGAALKGAGDYPYWQLVPRPIPPMERQNLPATTLGNRHFKPHTETEILIDNKVLTTGYPTLLFSRGKGAEIKISYAEALYDGKGNSKGNRNVTKGKSFIGYSDIILPDGGTGRSFEPLWWRTWRYMKLTVKTESEPLDIDGLFACSSMYPFERVSRFEAPGHPELSKMLDIGWRTARLCAHETYMDCPYYEQLQYFGDARIQAMVTMFNTKDTCMVRNLLEQGRQSVNADGLVASRYPSNLHQFIPPYALFWIDTCHDWWMYRGDEAYLKTLLPVCRSVIGYFGQYLCEDGSLRGVPFWNFADWASLKSGMFPYGKDGASAYMDLIYIIALRDAADMEEVMGSPALAREYRATADRMAATVVPKYWDSANSFFGDNTDRTDFSQHINSLAVLAGIVTGEEAHSLISRTLDDKSLRPCTIYFRYYLQRAMACSGNGDRLLEGLQVMRDQMALGLTTWAEMPEPSRSDCHAWGSSPNIEFFRIVLGIDSAAPGFGKVVVAPNLCGLKEVSGSIPHPCGEVSASFKLGADGALHGEITLPEGVTGEFVWKGESVKLDSGTNKI